MHRAKHRVLRRSITELNARSIDSISVGSLAHPILVRGNGNGKGGGGGGDGGNGNGNGNGGGGGGGNGNGNGGGGGKGGGGGGGGNSGGSGGGGSSNGGGNSSGGSPPIAASPTSGGGTPVPGSPAAIAPGPTSTDPAPGKPVGPSSAQIGSSGGGGGGGGTANLATPGSDGNFLSAARQTVPVEVGSAPSTTPGTLDLSTPVTIATDSPLPSTDVLSSSITLGTTASLPTASTPSAISSGKKLSGGAIAGITIVCLIFLISLALIVIRRRSIAHRVELRKQWWFSRKAANSRPHSPVESNREDSASRRSARSSFATNFDHGLIFRPDPVPFSVAIVPSLPPIAEVRERNSALISTGGSVARRESLNSMLSNGSDQDAQYLMTGQNNMEPSSPMSVRPFSPSESFSFPKPPAPLSAGNSVDVSGSPGVASVRSSTTTLGHLSPLPRAFMTDSPPPSALMSSQPQPLAPGVAASPFVAADPPTDVFGDPPNPQVSGIKVIRRPFAPTLDDELAVCPGDLVCIFRIFDDNWAYVEKLVDSTDEGHERGLIPVDCFRQIEQSLPTDLAENRVSYGLGKIGTAL